MPKLSTYVQKHVASDVAHDRAEANQRQAQGGATTSAQGCGPDLIEAAKLRDEFQKRCREHGPRLYRWPDGSLNQSQPPPNPYSAANRARLAALVEHCRLAGSDRERSGGSAALRYGIAVPYEQHRMYLVAAGLEPEVDASGVLRGLDPARRDPLADPEHCLRTFYTEGAAAVLATSAGRLL